MKPIRSFEVYRDRLMEAPDGVFRTYPLPKTIGLYYGQKKVEKSISRYDIVEQEGVLYADTGSYLEPLNFFYWYGKV